MGEKQTRHGVDGAAGVDPDDDPQRLAGVVVLRGGGLARRRGRKRDHGRDRRAGKRHGSLPAVLAILPPDDYDAPGLR
jgi:hypothetical protein